MTQTKNPSGYYQTIATLETTQTPSVRRFPDFGEYCEVIGCTHTTIKRIADNEVDAE